MQPELLLNTRIKPRQFNRRRRAMTLVEVMVVVALSSILLGVVVTLAVGLRQWDRRFRDHAVRSDQVARLGDSIRADIRRATDVSLPAANILVVAAPDKSQTRYELRPDGCRRVVKLPGDAPEKQSNSFTIGPAESWRLERGAPGRRPAIVVWLEGSHSDKAPIGSALLLVDAALGADLPAPAKTDEPGKQTSGP